MSNDTFVPPELYEPASLEEKTKAKGNNEGKAKETVKDKEKPNDPGLGDSEGSALYSLKKFLSELSEDEDMIDDQLDEVQQISKANHPSPTTIDGFIPNDPKVRL